MDLRDRGVRQDTSRGDGARATARATVIVMAMGLPACLVIKAGSAVCSYTAMATIAAICAAIARTWPAGGPTFFPHTVIFSTKRSILPTSGVGL
jgi:hypothetical protein